MTLKLSSNKWIFSNLNFFYGLTVFVLFSMEVCLKTATISFFFFLFLRIQETFAWMYVNHIMTYTLNWTCNDWCNQSSLINSEHWQHMHNLRGSVAISIQLKQICYLRHVVKSLFWGPWLFTSTCLHTNLYNLFMHWVLFGMSLTLQMWCKKPFQNLTFQHWQEFKIIYTTL